MSDYPTIEGKITTPDGKVTDFLFTPNGWSQWGADNETLGSRVEALDAIEAALDEASFFEMPEKKVGEE